MLRTSIAAVDRSTFVSNNSGLATEASHRFIFEADTRKLWFDDDGAGGHRPVLVATLNVASLASGTSC